MQFVTSDTIGGTVEILAADDYDGVPITVTEDADIVKAGTPLTKEGKSTTDTGAIGILLNDVEPKIRPIGTIIVRGIIDSKKAQEYSGVTYGSGLTDTLNAAGCFITMRDNIGVNT